MPTLDADPAASQHTSWRNCLLLAGFWTAVAWVSVLPQLSQGMPWRALVLAAFAQWWSWGLLAPAIVAVDARLPFSDRQWPRRILAHLVLALVFTAIYAYVDACMKIILGIAEWQAIASLQLLGDAAHGAFWSILIYGMIVGVWAAYRYQTQFAAANVQMERMERTFLQARLQNLRMQLDPHFLFNALNTISSQVERDPKLSRKMIEHLGDLLRLSLSSHRTPMVPLREEIIFLEHYLAIQKIRFGDKLNVQMNIDQHIGDALVPSLMLQPLVENAIRHGLSSSAAVGKLSIDANHDGNQLRIVIRDDGVGLKNGWQHGDGLGIAVTKERIEGLYSCGSAHFSIRSGSSGGTDVEIRVPIVRENEHG